jgi:hypothetical protein
MTDAVESEGADQAAEAEADAQTADLDPRVSTPDDGFPDYDDVDSTLAQSQDEDGYDESAADEDGEH